MIYFNNDYLEGAHPDILSLLAKSNLEQTPGYGEDTYCQRAAELIRERCKNESLDVHFLVGGTQTNLTAIASVLRPHQGVVCADTGHINVHESGAIEACGHKILAVPSPDGKVTARQVEAICRAHYEDETHEHMVQPGMLYLSNPTEVGTIYSRAELAELKKVCQTYHMPLYLDGARLGYGLCSRENDLDLPYLARTCDMFYIGGTKQGALFGEALVIANPDLKKDFRYLIKQKGGMLAKGRMLGIQFLALLEGELYFDMSRHAVRLADRIRRACETEKIAFRYPPQTNQLFLILKNDPLRLLEQNYRFALWEKRDESHSVIRICTSWATREEHVDALLHDIHELHS